MLLSLNAVAAAGTICEAHWGAADTARSCLRDEREQRASGENMVWPDQLAQACKVEGWSVEPAGEGLPFSCDPNNSALEEVAIYFHEAIAFSWELLSSYFLSLFTSKNSLHTS